MPFTHDIRPVPPGGRPQMWTHRYAALDQPVTPQPQAPVRPKEKRYTVDEQAAILRGFYAQQDAAEAANYRRLFPERNGSRAKWLAAGTIALAVLAGGVFMALK